MSMKIMYLAMTYVIGSVNFSIIFLKIFSKEDPRNYGSKNPGTTNVYRRSGIKLASIILLMDICRAALIGFSAKNFISNEYISLACIGLILGNRFPCFHNFAGGKGVANYLGFTIAISPISSFIGVIIWCSVFFAFRIPFIASFAMILVLCVGTILTIENSYLATIEAVSIIVFIVIFHRKNILQFCK